MLVASWFRELERSWPKEGQSRIDAGPEHGFEAAALGPATKLGMAISVPTTTAVMDHARRLMDTSDRPVHPAFFGYGYG
jgi:hypothetical protein